MRLLRHVLMGGACLAAAACVPPRAEPPAPQPAPQPVPVPVAPPPPPPPPPANWADIPLTAGTWSYRDEGTVSTALFGVPASEAQFTIRCNKGRDTIDLERDGVATAGSLTIRTSFTVRTLGAALAQDPMPRTTATLGARDPLFDSMAFSRGRFSVEAPGMAMLVLPAWPEVARVVEDCRR